MKGKQSVKCHDFPFRAMGSNCEIKLYAEDRSRAASVSLAAIDLVRYLEQRYSRYLKGNVMDAVNRVGKAGGTLAVDAETAGLLDYADNCFRHSDGLFDITSGVLRQAWDFQAGTLPDARLIEGLLERVGWDKVVWRAPELSFSRPGMELDFGGIVKEYAADRCATQLQEMGIRHGLINLGGDIRIIGPHPDGRPWQVGIRHPRDPERAAHRIELSRGGICSSGDYERCVKIGDRRYSHILNPKTGWPVEGMASVTVVADYCLVAGSVSTIAMLKQRAAKEWLQLSGLLAYWIDIDLNGGCTRPETPAPEANGLQSWETVE